MNKFVKVFRETLLREFFIVSCIFFVLLTGCSSSDETTAQYTPPQQQTTAGSMLRRLDALRRENDSLRTALAKSPGTTSDKQTEDLRAANSKLEQDNRAANARIADLEAQVSQLRDRLNATPPPQYTPPPTSYTPPPTYTPPPSNTPTISNAKASYDEAISMFKSRNYTGASSTLQAILDAGAGDLEDHCYYWLGECKYATKEYQGALDDFNRVLSFGKSNKKSDAQFMIANTYAKMGDKTRAREEYQKLIDKYPISKNVKQAKERMSKL